MSYVLPLLIAEGFCRVSDGKPFVIHKLWAPRSLRSWRNQVVSAFTLIDYF